MVLGTHKIRKFTLSATALVVTLGCTFALNPIAAHAATMEELQAKADEAMSSYQEARAEVEEIQSQVAEIQTKINENQARVDEIGAQIPQQQETTGESIRSLYKMQQSTPGLVSLLLSADSFSDFITTYQYINSIQRSNMAAIEELNRMKTELKTAQQELEVAKAETEQKQQEVEQKQQEAESDLASAQAAIQELNEQLAAQAAAEAARLAAEAAAAGQESSQGTNTETGTVSDASATDGSEVATDSSWMYGFASAYSLADNTGWDATASGEKLTDDSVTVAVPASQSYLLGRSVEIVWNGITITARVTDTGGFAQYGRVLDLAGGCWKAFGFSSPNDWGVRSVQYRFL